jgi:spore germination protein GerM
MRRAVAGALLLAIVLSGCGVSEDSEPRLIPVENVPFRLVEPSGAASTTAPPSPLTEAVDVYFISRSGDTPTLEATEREVPEAEDPRSRIEALLSQRPDDTEAAAGLTSSIPRDTTLLGAERLADDLVQIDLSSNLFDVSGPELVNAFAQLVYTATELDSVRRVRFLVDGQPRNAFAFDGQEKPEVTRADYSALKP